MSTPAPTAFSLEGRALKLSSAEDILPHLAPLLSSPATITSLSLQGNTIGVPAAVELSKHLPKLTSLTHANLADIFTARLLSEIPPALDALLTSLLPLPHLSTVDLSDNAFGLNTAGPLVKWLAKQTSLRHLILNNNGLGPEAGSLVANALVDLAAAQGGEGKIATVVCGRNRLENGSMSAWAKAVRTHGRALRSVKMVQNGIRPEGMSLLLREGLGAAKGLEVLDLQDNTFTSTGVAALKGVVGGWTELRELGVGDCLLGKKLRGVLEELAKGSNEKLQVLRLQYDELDAKFVELLVRVLTGGALQKLQRVELNGNKFSEEDENVEKLRQMLEERREAAGGAQGSEEWGLDELDDLEEEDSDEEEEEEEEDDDDDDEGKGEGEKKKKAEEVLKEADQEEGEKVAQRKDDDVDELAERLGKTGL